MNERYVELSNEMDGIQQVLNDPKMAFVWGDDPIIALLNDTCSLQSIHIITMTSVLYFRKDYPYFEVINHQ